MGMQKNIPRIVIAGTQSGVGKTTVVTGLLAALVARNMNVQSYKVGPDYIDPGFHSLASGKPAHNLDTWLMPPELTARLFVNTAQTSEMAVIEGVMGLYDGGRRGISSTAALAKLLKAPVILVVDAKSMGESIAATVLGYKNYDPEVHIAGVIVNRLGSATHKELVLEALQKIHIPVLGCLFRDPGIVLPERHLGLTPVTEYAPETFVADLGKVMENQLELDRIIELAGKAVPLDMPPAEHVPEVPRLRIGVAQDQAFSFYYPESLNVLQVLGAELVPFSPLTDQDLPAVDGLLLGGGFPEMFAQALAANRTMREAIRVAAQHGMPVYAECGGLMYLTRQLVDFSGQAYEMAGVIPATCVMEQKLQTVGYVEAMPLRDNLLCSAGQSLRGHEFHFSRLVPDAAESFPWAFTMIKLRTGTGYPGGYAANNVLASYLHMHFAGNKPAAHRFMKACMQYREQKQTGLNK
nr:cobyrinate a,c-diamide synthase [Propionispora vibrioides]